MVYIYFLYSKDLEHGTCKKQNLLTLESYLSSWQTNQPTNQSTNQLQTRNKHKDPNFSHKN